MNGNAYGRFVIPTIIGVAEESFEEAPLNTLCLRAVERAPLSTSMGVQPLLVGLDATKRLKRSAGVEEMIGEAATDEHRHLDVLNRGNS